MNKLCDLLITQDLSPRLIGKFARETEKVVIEIIDEACGIYLKIEDSSCFPIADTTRWSWPIVSIPNGIFRYIMTSDLGEVFEGKFSRGGK